MLQKIVEAHGGKLPDDVHVGFQNTGKERPETLDFIDQCAKHFGVNVVWTEYDRVWGQDEDRFRIVTYETASRNGEPFTKMLAYYRQYRAEVKDAPAILPNPTNRMCTSFLKIKVAEQWMRSLGYQEWSAIVGIRRDEPKRYARMIAANQAGRNRWDNVLPMYEAGTVQADVQAHWKGMPFDLGIDSDLGNCDLCFLKHENKIYRALMADPNMADWWIEREDDTGQRFRKDRAGYKEMKFVAQQMRAQMDMFPKTEDEESLVDCICG